jgi:acyl transferase domain-containing protein
VNWPLLAELLATEEQSRMGDPLVAQTCNFALQVALAAVWESRGIRPDAIIGHSAGEVAAAYAAGILTLEDAVTTIYHRARVLERIAGQGTMMAVAMPVEEAERVITPYRDRISIAAENGPASTTLSGDAAALEAVAAELAAGQIFCRTLRVNVAYHSYQLEPLRQEFLESLAAIEPRAGKVPMYSTVIATKLEGQEANAKYWWRNFRNTVRFREATDQLIEDSCQIFLEIGPHPVLAGSISECLSNVGENGHVFPSLRRGEDESLNLLASFGGLFTAGYPVDWSKLFPVRRPLVRLPAYPWQRDRYWLESDESRQIRLGERVHPLLGRRLGSPEPCWEVEISRTALPYLSDHRVQGAVVFPGAGYAEMGLAAAQQCYGPGHYSIDQLAFEKALFLTDGTNPRVRTMLDREQNSFAVYSQSGTDTSSWTLHAKGKLGLRQEAPAQPCTESTACVEEMSKADCYALFSRQGFGYGPNFQRIERLWRGFQEATAVINAERADSEPYGIHPSVLDGCFQVLIATDPFGGDSRGGYMPTGIDRVRVYCAPAGSMTCHARLTERSDREMKGDLLLYNSAGNLAVEVRGFHVKSLEAADGVSAAEKLERCFYQVEWHAAPHDAVEESNEHAGRWIIFPDEGGTGEALASVLRERGLNAVLVNRDCSHNADELEHLLSFDGTPCRGVVYLPAMDNPPLDHATPESLERADDALALIRITRAMARSATRARLWVVTRGAQTVGKETSPAAAAQAMLWGLGRVIGNQENAGIWGGLIDLDPDDRNNEATLIAAELSNNSGEEVAFRGGSKYVARLVRRNKPVRGMKPRFRTDATYLITGGLGALGLVTARWMVERGARRLILMGRSPLPSRSEWARVKPDSPAAARIRAIRELEAMGATVTPAPVDVANETELAEFLKQYNEQGWPAVRGVIHAAGVVRDELLADMDDETFRAVLRPKILGSLSLHRQFLNSELDFFVLFSSIGSQVVSAGQANYASANAFLDALAHYRRQQGLPGMSINWGPWVVGMVEELNLIEHLSERGMPPLTTARGIEMLDALIGQNDSQVTALSANWLAVFERQPVVRPITLHLGHDEEQENGGADEPPAGADLVSEILTAPATARCVLLETYLMDLTAKVLRLDRSRLEPGQALVTLGMDSLMASELKNRIELNLGVRLSVVDLLQGLNVSDLAARLLPQIAPEPGVGQIAAVDAQTIVADVDPEMLSRMVAEIAQLPESAVQAMIASAQ